MATLKEQLDLAIIERDAKRASYKLNIKECLEDQGFKFNNISSRDYCQVYNLYCPDNTAFACVEIRDGYAIYHDDPVTYYHYADHTINDILEAIYSHVKTAIQNIK